MGRRKRSRSRSQEKSAVHDCTDEQLVERAKEKPAAFAELYHKYAREVYNYFWYRCGYDADLAEDLTQETFLHAFEHLEHHTHRGVSYLTYLLAIAHNLLANQYRKKRTLSLETLVEDVPEELQTPNNKELLDLIWKTVQRLTTTERDLLLLRYQKEYSMREIAHVLSKSENAVKLLLARTQRKLRGAIKPEALKGLVDREPKLQPPPFDKHRRGPRNETEPFPSS